MMSCIGDVMRGAAGAGGGYVMGGPMLGALLGTAGLFGDKIVTILDKQTNRVVGIALPVILQTGATIGSYVVIQREAETECQRDPKGTSCTIITATKISLCVGCAILVIYDAGTRTFRHHHPNGNVDKLEDNPNSNGPNCVSAVPNFQVVQAVPRLIQLSNGGRLVAKVTVGIIKNTSMRNKIAISIGTKASRQLSQLIPGVALGTGLLSAAQRAHAGHYRTAALETVGAVLSVVPGFNFAKFAGTIGIDVLILGDDIYAAYHTATN